MQKFILIALGGGAGALSRYILAGLAQRFGGGSFPVGTFAVNALGCLLFGLIWGLMENRAAIGPHTRLMVLTGFLGAFTTFSTYAFESAALMRAGQWMFALLNIAGQNIVGIALLMTGLMLARLVP